MMGVFEWNAWISFKVRIIFISPLTHCYVVQFVLGGMKSEELNSPFVLNEIRKAIEVLRGI